ncbi:GNAT family N-acetyltransferase [Streptomyces sviceus]|uniref:GNAT family N-acetyltransferase n=1 Tax=Streptomyces sviceus TaxID=285530 RepID=UPI0036F185F3
MEGARPPGAAPCRVHDQPAQRTKASSGLAFDGPRLVVYALVWDDSKDERIDVDHCLHLNAAPTTDPALIRARDWSVVRPYHLLERALRSGTGPLPGGLRRALTSSRARTSSGWPAMGWIRSLGIVRDARGRGLGGPLLRQAFAVFAARGRDAAGLGVDTENATGAPSLYARNGMSVHYAVDTREIAVS